MIEEWQYELKTGSEKALKIVFSEYYALLCSVAFQYVRDIQTSENIASDCIITIWEKRDIIFPTHTFRAYILKMARNRSIDYLRTRRISTVGIGQTGASCFLSDEDVFENYICTELSTLIGEKLGELSPQCRRVFELSRYDNKSYKEIAAELGISENTVKYHIKTALAHLRKELNQ